MTRSHVSRSTSTRRPHASVPAAVTTPRRSPWRSAMRWTAASAAAVSERSTASCSWPSSGAARSSTTGVPPAAATLAATARPSPEAPPVTITVPSATGALLVVSAGAVAVGVSDGMQRGLLDESGGGAALDERQDDRAAAPLGEDGRLGQVGDGVVAALDPDVGSQLAQDLDGRVLLEEHDVIDAAQRGEHGGAVLLALDGPAGTLQAADRGVGVQADDEAVAERPGGLQRVDVAGMQQVEAAAGRHDRAALRPRPLHRGLTPCCAATEISCATLSGGV